MQSQNKNMGLYNLIFNAKFFIGWKNKITEDKIRIFNLIHRLNIIDIFFTEFTEKVIYREA